jgi:hypothetical protein
MCGGWLGDRIEDIGDSGQDVIDTVSDVGSAFDDSVLKTIKEAGSSIEDEFDRALADPVLGPIITVVAQVYGGPAAVAALKYKQTGELSDALEAGAKAYIIQQVATNVMAPDPNAVGGVTGPDNIDVGGGWSPAAGATAAELAAARLALETGDVANTAIGNPYQAAGFDTSPVDASTVKSSTSLYETPPVNTGDEAGVLNGDYPELLGEAGGNAFPLEPSQEGLIPLGDAAGATAAEIAAAKVEMAAKGLTFKDALNYVRAGLVINSLTGDPLGLSGDTGGGGGSAAAGSTGFAIVPVPAEWKSPTYAAPAAPIDINSLFTDMNLLGGTQWQGLPTQKPNLSFNDIFASGQQSTPMGTPVDINQIVSAILGQNTVSQKSA